jgi:predicted DNA-binding protein YlxM (UPF0122 family)
MKPKFDWKKMQEYYDQGHTMKEVCEKFGISQQAVTKSRYFKTRTSEEQHAMAVKTRIQNGNHKHNEHTKKKLSEIAIKRGFGGKNYRKNFVYKGINLESSYELLLAKELDKNKINWIRPKRLYWIDATGKNRHYTPDFYLPDYNVYLDPKNDYLIKIDSEKIKLCSDQNNVIILVLSKKELLWETIQNKMRD